MKGAGTTRSIIAWCPFNEGWGQHDTLRYAAWIKEVDPTRLVDEASGFPWHGGGDIQDNHGGVSRPNPRQIGIVSENGGYGVATPGHDWPCEIWTYQTYYPDTGRTIDAMGKGIKGQRLPRLDEKSRAWFTKQVARLYTELWNQKDTNGMTGQFFCQLYDTESECDGLVRLTGPSGKSIRKSSAGRHRKTEQCGAAKARAERRISEPPKNSRSTMYSNSRDFDVSDMPTPWLAPFLIFVAWFLPCWPACPM